MEKLVLTSLLILVFSISLSTNAFADQSTITKYCSNGLCSTGPLSVLPPNYTHAVSKLPLLIVSYSQTCENMVKNHISGCPTMESMVPYDTSNQYISGKLIKQGNETIRTNPQVKNHWLWYDGKKTTSVCIDCKMDIASSQKSQNIIIEPTSYSFADKNNNIVTTKLSYQNDRYMQGCDTATISNIPNLLNDTIHYMLSGCITTNFSGNVTKSVHVSAWDYDNPFSTLHQSSYLTNIMHGHLYYNGNKTLGGLGPNDCIRHQCSFIDPYKKIGY